MDNRELFDKLFTLELQVGFLIPKMIKVLDGLAGDHKASSYLIAEMENIISQLPNTEASHDERFTKAAKDALATVKRSLDKKPNRE
ncbi:hypothetical protein NCI32_000829 [Salmonella enterica]|uniref:Uncharacterized protein n=1 Tax=Salmonella enterica subsp. enterica serovar Poona TaxID=436295 RepID=A0A625LDT9_SALET|nr:hypothetical protein [Salmonella enterica]EAA8440885.1 hypothetical protein [Salmonella enterica subsp. enterica]EAN4564562.1 hypothetical protein [Salmonella enterica subsp. enterica serovar Senftenberg]EAU5123362.1 hypothetical protein [Salmonella enterica subsp. enterica serovar Infantis]ECZ8883521.1 hypothetical protein [Salmonella enterica subsp. enterica serovar Poona]EDD1443093.1 hypothetical protein [Salmonella enterica subsp. enterica serovar Amsterdam]EDO2467492.1 hypothetical pr